MKPRTLHHVNGEKCLESISGNSQTHPLQGLQCTRPNPCERPYFQKIVVESSAFPGPPKEVFSWIQLSNHSVAIAVIVQWDTAAAIAKSRHWCCIYGAGFAGVQNAKCCIVSRLSLRFKRKAWEAKKCALWEQVMELRDWSQRCSVASCKTEMQGMWRIG